MIPTPLMIVYGFFMPSLLLWAIIFHELGHYLYFRLVLKKDPKLTIEFSKRRISLGDQSDYLGVSKAHKILLNLSGIVVGSLPLWFFIPGDLSNPVDVVLVYVIALYFFGCARDIMRITNYIMEYVEEAEKE